jgi:hypothetical protein
VAFGIGGTGITIFLLVLAAPGSSGSGRLVALRRFLPATGLTVADAGAPPSGGGAFVLLVDHRTSNEERALMSWADKGGRIVVTDPSSELFSRFDVSTHRAGVFGVRDLSPGCVRPEVTGVRTLEVAATDGLLSSPAESAGCFADASGSYALFVPAGRGEIVLLGGSSILSDALLNHADDAAFARSLLDAGGPVVFGSALPPGASGGSVWSLIPTRGKTVLWELALAAVAFALARGRRLGRPIPEEPLSPIPAGALVEATARLYRRSRSVAFCGSLVRASIGERLSRRLGIPPDPDLRRLADTIARIVRQDAVPIEHVLAGPAPASDDELVALCRELESLTAQIEGVER